MFASIKWRFIVVYFLLVFIAMVIVGIFIIGRLESQQIANITSSMEQNIQTIIESISELAEDDWMIVQEDIQETLSAWGFGSNETLYVIKNDDIATVIASSSKKNKRIIGESAFINGKYMDSELILAAYNGEKLSKDIPDSNENTVANHIAYPVLTDVGKVKGIIYMVSDLENVYVTVNESKKILTNATMIALIITVFLGYLIASSITEPIRDVTNKAEEMAMGNFEQFVEVKSDDEIGQLASMFNHLTLKLKDTIREMDLERSKLDTIFNYMAEGVIAVDLSGNIIHANPIAIEILELTQEKSLEPYSIFREAIPLKLINLDDINYDDETTLEGDRSLEIDSHVYKVKYAPFKNERNNIGGLIIVFQDMTNEHKLDNMRKEFVANVSHELKTPITTIKSYTETLMDDGIDEEMEQRFLAVIDNECDRMARLVKDLLQLSNLDYKKTTWKKQEVSAKKLLKEILLKLEFAFKEKNHKIIVDVEENLPNIVIDKDGIEQVILNIISNAIKYTENGGEIQISSRCLDDTISIKVKDNGIGIPEEDRQRIFERFYRVEKGRSRESGGTGLGLSIAKQIIEAHNGEILLDSCFGEGTTVEIKIPYEKV
ncbi:cell wall metabolism sensor histidine kinase WalK [Tissierella carlieri]|uniref:histidine kinase n=1 Tax=Tissierella carlieri TaxID=689904 RepID=A0ABT1SDX0_9FIRM|nr:ATP-binding protein [Tissierella carlieri]MBU5311371.1 cell wall metabolism sensor histidine kinase WalK [Tissierella carlieri]MCQ4924658.1 cell wall metabolism sensor histidine kinase WalK [Tissierella carlieri]